MIVLHLVQTNTYGQKIIIRNTLRADTFFAFYFNPIRIGVNEGKAGDVKIVSDEVTVINEEDNKYYLRSLTAGYKKLYFNIANKLIDSLEVYFTDELPLPAVKFCHDKGLHAPSLHIFDSLCIIPPLADSKWNKKITYRVVSFCADVFENGNIVYQECNQGAQFSQIFNKKLEQFTYEKIKLTGIVAEMEYNGGRRIINIPNFLYKRR